MAQTIDLNADMGESFGRWTLGNDEALMPHLTSANIACGFHGGDPHVMRRTVALALEHGVGIGAHVGLPDLLGFGRRRMAVSAAELRDYVLYQAGAMQAFADAAGASMQHVKPHGVMYTMVQEDGELAQAVADAVAEVGADVILMLAGTHGGGRGRARPASRSFPRATSTSTTPATGSSSSSASSSSATRPTGRAGRPARDRGQDADARRHRHRAPRALDLRSRRRAQRGGDRGCHQARRSRRPA